MLSEGSSSLADEPGHAAHDRPCNDWLVRMIRVFVLGAITSLSAIGIVAVAPSESEATLIQMSRLSHPQGSVRPCRASQLRLELGPLVSEQSEQDSIGFEFLNVSTATCSLNGYPKVELIGKNAVVLPFTYSHLGDAEVTSKLPSIVSLRACAAAYVMINQRACVLHTTRQALWARLIVPGASGGTVVSLSHRPFIAVCQPNDPAKGPIAVSPFESSERATSPFESF